MASSTAESAVRTYLAALKDPSALRNDDEIANLEQQLANSDDAVERLLLRQQLIEARNPSTDTFEEAFVNHAKEWADDQGVTASAFADEGVPVAVLRRAGFRVGGRRTGRQGRGRSSGSRSRVSADEVRSAIPRGSFTIKGLQEASGASPGVVRRVVQEELEAGKVKEIGPDPDHQGPGRTPTLYRR